MLFEKKFDRAMDMLKDKNQQYHDQNRNDKTDTDLKQYERPAEEHLQNNGMDCAVNDNIEDTKEEKVLEEQNKKADMELEKKDFTALVLSAVIVFLPIAVIILLIMVFIANSFVH